MIDSVEELFQIKINNPPVSFRDVVARVPYGLLRTAPAQQLLSDVGPCFAKVVRQVLDGHPVNARCSLVGLDPF